MRRKTLALLGVALLAAAVVGVTVAAGDGVPPKPTSLPDGGVLPDPESVPAISSGLTDLNDRGMWETLTPYVNRTPLTLPEDALLDGMVAKAHPTVAGPEGLSPLHLPIYVIVRDGESASVSATTGEFQIGAGHQETFQFLIDQLGRDKMQLVETEFYEKRWGPFRADYQTLPGRGDVPPARFVPDTPNLGRSDRHSQVRAE